MITNDLNLIKEFIKKLERKELTTTDAKVVNNINFDLYNVEGSNPDRNKVDNYKGLSWKKLMISKDSTFSSCNCYVTNTSGDGLAPPNTSHNNFSVGGHMTRDPQGQVSSGSTCYLMPLCYWHNNTARDRVAFKHTNTKMLELSGYLQGELAATFELRLPSELPYVALYYDGIEWKCKNLDLNEFMEIQKKQSLKLSNSNVIDHYMLFERNLNLRNTHDQFNIKIINNFLIK